MYVQMNERMSERANVIANVTPVDIRESKVQTVRGVLPNPGKITASKHLVVKRNARVHCTLSQFRPNPSLVT